MFICIFLIELSGLMSINDTIQYKQNLSKADTWLKRTKFLGPVGVHFNQVSLYFLSKQLGEKPCLFIVFLFSFNKFFNNENSKKPENL